MKNKTFYSYELLTKMNIKHTKKVRRNTLIYSLVTLVASVGLIIGCVLKDCLDSMTMYVGVFFLAMSFISFCAFSANRKKKLQQAIKKSVDENPNKIMEYQFEENFITINQTSDKVQSNTRIEYSYINRVERIDDTSFYFVTKNNVFYVVEDEQNIDESILYLSEKLKEFAGK